MGHSQGELGSRGGVMQRLIIVVAAVALTAVSGSVRGALLEVATSCEKAHDQIEELIKNPDTKEVDQIMEALGVDTLASCDVPKGHITCFQCLDKDQKLRAIQIFRNEETKTFTLKGYGCECTDVK
jgi:hypothetical protein